MLSPAILISTVGGSEAYLAWVVFSALLVSGVTTVIQVARVGRIGSGYLLLMGSSSVYLAICVTALERGGGGLLGSLIIVSSLFQFLLAAKLSLFRRIFTPTVAGTVLILIPITVSPIILRKLADVPTDAAPAAAPVTAAVTLVVIATRSPSAPPEPGGCGPPRRGWWRAARSAACSSGSTTPERVLEALLDRGGRHWPGRASTWASAQTSGRCCPPSCC